MWCLFHTIKIQFGCGVCSENIFLLVCDFEKSNSLSESQLLKWNSSIPSWQSAVPQGICFYFFPVSDQDESSDLSTL